MFLTTWRCALFDLLNGTQPFWMESCRQQLSAQNIVFLAENWCGKDVGVQKLSFANLQIPKPSQAHLTVFNQWFLYFEQLNIAATAMFFADFLKRKPTNWMMLEISNHICWSLNSVVSKKQQAPSGCRRFFQDFGINRFEEEAFNKTN